ncbi:epididymal secretory protein E1-like [Lingula anatina]|uniref:Epididymal secretory protein E1-like n=1 Tax=Lingula anatina TaxID=7574 RepID=A0A1S3JBU3_LINAN|nr:epididymal secretory protein E1-like [Lingula anatina]|eukprot:XP_013407656.1 epididymal secretory protein E1-like [Lingula anatina]
MEQGKEAKRTEKKEGGKRKKRGTGGKMTYAVSTSIQACEASSEAAMVKSVNLEPCNDELCTLQGGNSYTYYVKFTTERNIEKVYLKAKADLVVWIPVPLQDANGCRALSGQKCPLVAGQTYTVAMTINIQEGTPQVRAVIKLEMTAPNDVQVFCTEVPAQLYYLSLYRLAT